MRSYGQKVDNVNIVGSPGLSKVCFTGKEAGEGGESNLIVLKMTYEMEILLSFQVMLVQRSGGIEFCLGQKPRQFQNVHCWLEAVSILAGNTNANLLV